MMLRSERYLAFVRARKCIAPGCRQQAEAAHHFDKRNGGGGTAVKPHDSFTVPLCAIHHDHVHTQGALEPLDAMETEMLFYAFALRCMTAWVLNGIEAKQRKEATKPNG